MQYLDLHEKIQHGTVEFPLEYHYLDAGHPRYVMDYHWHQEYEIIRILEGELAMTLDEEERTVRPGDIVFVHGGILHSGRPKSCVYECLIFDLHTLLKLNPLCSAYLEQLLNQTARVTDLFPPSHLAVSDILSRAFAAMAEQPTGYELITFGALYQFFGLVFGNHYYQETTNRSRRGHQKILQLKNALDFMDQNYSGAITLEQLASAASMSPKYFCRFFHQMTHRTPMDYLNYQRVERACYELSTTDHTVTEVAYNCGFNDLSYFIKTFRRYKGITPGKYQI